ncbi:hypothetical protein A2Z00_05690 [Candidatus Gottesmanbacteria bacterium RBG_13_45_10]|uniref:Glycosyltransferase RgtA/B/C/D-like domain-containing protein n=1 Tax=Candidatus Gottesmanbacteria bacterium RBG_13_45_10 TaxID=1798370 RepID=A0A1F5ZGJ4_9BACT|nr:MAG: hypothetical protein A2Z00_05690 [Candidatus Gottesmanbacteria bacterium RBG_13_45_10]
MVTTFWHRHRTAILLSFIFVVALFFRLYHIHTIPFGLNNDAAWEGSAALDILRGNWQNYLPYAAEGWRGEGIVRIVVAMLIPIIGPTPLAIQLPTIIFGLVLLIPLYFLIRRLFSERLAFLTTFFVATSGWHITMSKSGWRAITVPLFATLFFWSVQEMLHQRKPVWSIISGVSLALSLYSYDAGRMIPFFALLLFLCWVATHQKPLQYHIKNIAILLVAFIITAAPMGYYAMFHWENFIGRSNFLFVGNAVAKSRSWKPIWDNVSATALLFTHRGNGNDFFVDAPLLDPPAKWLFPIGFVIALWYALRAKQRRFQFMLAWFFVSLVPPLLSVPNGNRAIGAIPTAFFFVSLGAVGIADFFAHALNKYRHLIRTLIVGFICVFTGATTFLLYLGPHHVELPGFYPETRVATDYIKTVLDTHDIYITDNFPRELLTYSFYRGGDPFIKNYTWFPQKESMLDITPNPNRGIVFVLLPTEDTMSFIDTLLTRFPHARRFLLPYTTSGVYRDAAIIVEVPQNSVRR